MDTRFDSLTAVYLRLNKEKKRVSSYLIKKKSVSISGLVFGSNGDDYRGGGTGCAHVVSHHFAGRLLETREKRENLPGKKSIPVADLGRNGAD